MKVAFVIFGEPASLKNSRELVMMYRKKKDGSKVKAPAIIKSEKARNYERDAMLQIPHTAKKMFEGPVKVTLRIFYASERPDLDESVVLDIMQAKYEGEGKARVLKRTGVYINDRQVREKHIYHAIDRANPRTEIEVETLVEQQVDLFGVEISAAPSGLRIVTGTDQREPF